MPWRGTILLLRGLAAPQWEGSVSWGCDERAIPIKDSLERTVAVALVVVTLSAVNAQLKQVLVADVARKSLEMATVNQAAEEGGAREMVVPAANRQSKQGASKAVGLARPQGQSCEGTPAGADGEAGDQLPLRPLIIGGGASDARGGDGSKQIHSRGMSKGKQTGGSTPFTTATPMSSGIGSLGLGWDDAAGGFTVGGFVGSGVAYKEATTRSRISMARLRKRSNSATTTTRRRRKG